MERKEQQDISFLQRFPWLATLLEKAAVGLGGAQRVKGSTGSVTSPVSPCPSKMRLQARVGLWRMLMWRQFSNCCKRRDQNGLWKRPAKAATSNRASWGGGGGGWLQAHRGRAYAAFKGEAQSAGAKSWCLQHGLAQSSRYDVTAHGERGASVLSLAWCHRMRFLHDAYLDSGESPAAPYSELVAEGYVEPADFMELLSGLHGRNLQRALATRAILPTGAASLASSGAP